MDGVGQVDTKRVFWHVPARCWRGGVGKSGNEAALTCSCPPRAARHINEGRVAKAQQRDVGSGVVWGQGAATHAASQAEGRDLSSHYVAHLKPT